MGRTPHLLLQPNWSRYLRTLGSRPTPPKNGKVLLSTPSIGHCNTHGGPVVGGVTMRLQASNSPLTGSVSPRSRCLCDFFPHSVLFSLFLFLFSCCTESWCAVLCCAVLKMHYHQSCSMFKLFHLHVWALFIRSNRAE